MQEITELKASLAFVAGLPEAEARCLPGRLYTSPEYFQHEVDAVLGKAWQCVGCADEVPDPGRNTRRLLH